MSTTTFTKFAVLGAGGVGGGAVDELLKTGRDVTILTRDDAKPELVDFKARGARVVKVDYSDKNSIAKALQGAEVVINAILTYDTETMLRVIHAAKAAGAQLFVPPEYGVYVTDGMNAFKKAAQDTLKELQLPYTLFYTGLFFGYTNYILGIDYEKATIRIVGDGKTKFSLVKSEDVGRFVGHAVSTAAKSDLKWAKIPLESDRLTGLEVAELVEKKSGKKATIEFVDYEENKKGYLSDYRGFLTTLFADGRGVPGTEEEVAATKAKYFPAFAPTSFAAFLGLDN